MLRALLAALAVLAGAAPPALAQGAEPIEGGLTLRGPVLVEGEGVVASPDGALDLTGAVRAGEPLAFAWEDAQGWLVTRNWTRAKGPAVVNVTYGRLPDNDTLPGGPARLHGFACGASCVVVAFGLGGEGTRVGLAGAFRGRLSWSDAPALYWADTSAEGRADAYRREVPAGAFLAGGASPLAADAAPLAEGRVALLVRGATVTLEQDGATRTLDTTRRGTEATDPLGLARAEHLTAGFLYVEMDGATLRGASETTATLRAPGATLDLAGGLRAADATGVLRWGLRDVALHGDDLALDGRLRLDLAPLALPAKPLAGLQPQEPPSPQGRLSGEATRLRIGGADVEPLALAAPLAAGAALLVLLGLAALGLYTRIARGTVLDQPRRRRVLDAIAAAPGATAADLARATGCHPVLVQYHLRFLAANALVVGRRHGRRTRWFPPEAAPQADRLAAELALREESRRLLARAVAEAAAPVTQADLAGRTSLSPRLVSYHLARLQACGLVRSDGARPRRYAPAPALADALK